MARIIADARLSPLTEARTREKFASDIRLHFPSAGGGVRIRIARAVRVSCPVPGCPGVVGHVVEQEADLGIETVATVGWIAPQSYVEVAPGEFGLGKRAGDRGASRRHITRRAPGVRDAYADAGGRNEAQARVHPIASLAPAFLVRCPGCPHHTDRWLRIDTATALDVLASIALKDTTATR